MSMQREKDCCRSRSRQPFDFAWFIQSLATSATTKQLLSKVWRLRLRQNNCYPESGDFGYEKTTAVQSLATSATNIRESYSRPNARRNTIRRGGFSLLEVMLATAMLAASAMVLSSLLGLGAKFGSRAEARTESLSQAQSLLAEFLAMPGEEDELESERTGLLNSTPPRSFRIRVVEVSPTGGNSADSSSSSTTSSLASPALSNDSGYGDGSLGTATAGAPQPSRLVLVTVEVFETADADAETTQAPLTQLSQLVRMPAVEEP